VTLLGRPYPTWRVCRAFDQIPPHIARSVPPLRRDGSGAAAALCDAGGPRKYIAMRGRQDPNAMFERMAGLRCIKPLCNTTVTQTAFAACVRTPMLGANSADPGGDRRSRGCRRRMHCSRYVARARHTFGTHRNSENASQYRRTRGDSQSTRVTPEMSKKISTTRRNLVSSIRSKRRSPSHVPATTAGKHQK
jgi:hypothetical protein